MPIKIAILGGSGYTALELIKILLRHPHARIITVTSRQEGTPHLREVHPGLTGMLDLRLEPFDVDYLLARGVQCVFGCLPHGASMSTLPRLLERGMRVIDLSADYRLRDPNVYAQWYGQSHEDLAHLAQAVYGLPELYGDDIPSATYVEVLSRLPVLKAPVMDLAGSETPAAVASATEFVLEGLHLSKRLNKEAAGGRATYRAR